jgi:hypothetical protein
MGSPGYLSPFIVSKGIETVGSCILIFLDALFYPLQIFVINIVQDVFFLARGTMSFPHRYSLPKSNYLRKEKIQ